MYKITKAIKTSIACPSQWDLWDENGVYFYVRYRWGNLTVDKDEVIGTCILDVKYGDGINGWLNFDELKELTKEIFEFDLK